MVRRALQSLDAYFGGLHRNAILLWTLLAAIGVGLMDFRGSAGLLIVYVGPVAFGAWYGGKRVGSVVAIYCATAWFLAVTLFGNASALVPAQLWSLVVRLLMFLVISHIISRLREAMRQQKELTEFIVHDLRSPISSSITGLLTLQQTAANLDETESEMVALALVSNQRALALVNSILDVAKLETGKMPIQAVSVDLDGFCSDCLDQVTLWAKGLGVELVKDVRVANTFLDPVLTSRVVVNLLSNALKFSPHGGEVRLTVLASGHAGVRFSVSDNGPGIPSEYAKTIFEPFAQVAGTKGGTGLGLTFCRLAVQAQGGKIWVESAVGRGTTMHFTLHVHAASNPQAVSPVPAPAQE
ncbi:MAG TPA: HAMP domain-containing sensor histidine kinase [Fimbriimonas sp.]|nr:HAMP domain-containing sensor histidine kinase [Fimbriimonas sp.]